MQNKKHQLTISELRGIGLVILGGIALVYYYSWWFTVGPISFWLMIAFLSAFIYGLVQLVGNWLLYLATHYRTLTYPPARQQFTVDIFITAYHENHTLVERALVAACNLPEEKKVWLLADGDDPELAQMAACLGVGYLTRSDRRHAKAGNIK